MGIGSEGLVLHTKGTGDLYSIFAQFLRRVLNKQDSEGKLALKSKQVEKAAAYCLFFCHFAVSFLGEILTKQSILGTFIF